MPFTLNFLDLFLYYPRKFWKSDNDLIKFIVKIFNYSSRNLLKKD